MRRFGSLPIIAIALCAAAPAVAGEALPPVSKAIAGAPAPLGQSAAAPTQIQLKQPASAPLVIAPRMDDRMVAESEATKAPMTRDARRTVLKPLIAEAALVFGLPQGLVDALVEVESGYNDKAVSKSGAGGLMQLMPQTAKAMGVEDRFDPRANVMAGVKYFKNQVDKFGDVPKALAAYKMGPRAVDPNAKTFTKPTQSYIDRVMSIWDSRKDEDQTASAED